MTKVPAYRLALSKVLPGYRVPVTRRRGKGEPGLGKKERRGLCPRQSDRTESSCMQLSIMPEGTTHSTLVLSQERPCISGLLVRPSLQRAS